MKKIAFGLMITLLVGTLLACALGEVSRDELPPVEISFWIPTGEDATYYASYEENPVVRYLESKTYNGQKIDLKFVTPVAGSERENFNTLLSTEEYCDLMNMDVATISAIEMYEDGTIYDLTPYVEQYMPNYAALLKEYPEVQPYVYSNVNGEKKILQIYTILDEPTGNFMGWCYRRDWIAKYGTNPQTGASFTYGYADPADYNTYYDDVVFPSGGTDPVYLSDWEWMFDIFTKALEQLGIEDGYCTSFYYKGFSETGSLFAGFGGGAPLWYRDLEGNAAFNGNTESMRAYLECLHAWYEKGWLDRSFAEHTNDQIFSIDSEKIHSGKVGMWIGRRAETGGQLDMGDAYTKDIMVYGAFDPINDLYGAEETRNKDPYSLYQYIQVNHGIVVSNKVSEEELPTVLFFLDSLYTPEGGALCCFGLTAEQQAEIKDPVYARFGLEEGAYGKETSDAGEPVYVRNEKLLKDSSLATAVSGKRLGLGYYAKGFVAGMNASYELCARTAMEKWDHYKNLGTIDAVLRAQFTAEESSTYDKVHSNIDAYLAVNLPKFIRGDLNVESEEDWKDYGKLLRKYGQDKVTVIYQRIFDLMK